MDDLKRASVSHLLETHASIMDELRRRGVLRSANNPTGDLAEHLFCTAFGWEQAPNAEKGFDASDANSVRYQIKGRRLHKHNKSRQLSAIRDLNGFDVLAAVLFDDNYRVTRAALMPQKVVEQRSTYVPHTNSYKFILGDNMWDDPEVLDVTQKLRAAENS